jgi:isopenicillin-N N-acyltransferase-like protein
MIPLVTTGGPYYAIGHDVGSFAREQIAVAVAATYAEFAEYGDRDPTSGLGPYIDAIAEHASAIVEEMKGMAAGAGVSFEDIALLNASAELNQESGRLTECTVAGITQEGTPDGRVLLAHNEDSTAGWDALCYVVHATPDDAPPYAAYTYAGLMLHQGVNGAGIGSVGNALYVPDAQPGVPKLVQYRRALTAETIEQAIRLVTGPERAFGNNHLLASADGDIYDIEVTGKHWRIVDAGNTFLVHANHLIHPDLVHLDNDEDLLNSRLRQNRLTRLIQSSWGTITPESLRAMLSDHANYPKSICKHSAPESDLDYGTIGSVVIDVSNRALWACAGNPCRSEWREVRV